MNAFARRLALGAFALVAAPLGAQAPMRPAGGGPGDAGPAAGASFLLSRAGELQLTDAQVVRLAAVARREAAQRRAMMASMDSVRRTAMATRRDTNPRRRDVPPQLETRVTQAREQRQANLRDAIAVLTPDQQAEAWQMIGRGGMREGGMRRDRMRERMMRDRAPQGRGMAPARPNGLRREGVRPPVSGRPE